MVFFMGIPKISVIVPAHNEAQALVPTLASLVAQDCGDFEVVVACNGCADRTAQIAAEFPGVRVVESELSGMSFGKNFGAAHAVGELLIFVDADTTLPPEGLRRILEAVGDKPRVIGTVAGRPDRGGPVVRVCFWIANLVTRRKRVHAPGGVMVMQRSVYDAVQGFDEHLPQGTSTDLIMRALAAGAEYLFIHRVKATTSIRRFEKKGIIRQMLDWRSNHQKMAAGRHEEVSQSKYENFR